MAEYRLKPGKLGKKVINGYKKVEEKFTDTFLEKDENSASGYTLKTGKTAEKVTGAYQKIITANGDDVSLTLGENDDSGVYDDAELQLVFTLDSKGGYDLVAYMDGTQLSKADRDSLLAKLSQQVK